MKKCVVTILGILFLALPGAAWDKDFRQWLEGFYPRVADTGISRATWETAFDGIDQPDARVLEKARFQPEFTLEIWEYLDSRVTPLSVERGLQMERQYDQTLAAVENRFGVEASVLLAIWSMESDYGAVFEKPERLHYVPQSLATLAYADPRRKNFAEKQLIAVLLILQAGDVGRQDLTGSWAGAMGHTQFIPTSYLAYAVDMDGNGRRDIWNSVPDALATAANLLHRNGWQSGKTWGYEVLLPAGGERWLDKTTPGTPHIIDLGSLDGILGCVDAGLGFAVIPRSALDTYRGHENFAVSPLPHPFDVVEIHLAWRHDHRPVAAHRALIGMFSTAGSDAARV